MFNIIIKPALFPFALFVSFFLIFPTVPILEMLHMILQDHSRWEPPVDTFEPYSFWWLPLLHMLCFFISYMAYSKLRIEIIRTPATETIDRLIESATSDR
jgi:ABC-type polysaccharide/polyol phosphate export permease